MVHFHAVIRLDAPGDDYRPPPPGIDAAMLCDAVRTAAAAVRIAQPDGTGTAITLRFGAPQGTDVRPIRRDDLAGTGQPLNHQAVANYIAKYATKTLDRPRPARPAAPAPGGDRAPALPGPPEADDHHRLAARRQTPDR